ncbi:monalysin family beta-barrel pore-forming toxin [Pseudomonas tructae]|uniref:Monalysin family beta-barrel pore-forming toxin n=1 Tax=Pseudomonas tructae TaxID=2518644 RepID=A0A411MEX7_9PSED|nr:monalysin family beta-barrel pore-forming toxin [Pseudomonas tructae]QBF25412.1 monalysin family beta-barrel pore-forming toxin [Pseudomonas tructae]
MDAQEQSMLKGTYAIERHLFGGADLKAGGWVQGHTVVGKISIGRSVLEYYTRPIYAYLVYCGMIRSNGEDAFSHSHVCSRGLSAHFLTSLGLSFEVDPAIERVNGLSEIVGGFAPASLWGATHQQSQQLYLKGIGDFAVYQMHMAYAHAPYANENALVEHNPKLARRFVKIKDQSILVSSIAFANVFAIQREFAIDPMGWETVQGLVLDGARQDRWQFDAQACQSSSHRY